MPIEVELPDGNIVEFPDGTDNATMERALAQYAAKPARPDFSNVTTKVTPGRGAALRGRTDTGISNLIRGKPQPKSRVPGLAGRSVAQGVGGLADFGRSITPIGIVEGLASPFMPEKMRLPAYRDMISGALDRAGVASPQTTGERIASDVGEAVTGTALTMGAGGLARIPALTRGPVMQMLGTITGAGAMSGAREAGAPAPVQLGAGLLGGLAPSAAGVAGRSAISRLTGPRGSERRMGARLLEQAGGPVQIQESQVPGVRRTLDEAVDNQGIMAYGRNLRRQYPQEFADQDAANNAARYRALEGIAGDDDAMEAASALRAEVAEPFYQQAGQAVVPVTDELGGVLSRIPNNIMSSARRLARIEGNQMPESPGTMTGQQLHYIKLAIDNALSGQGGGSLGNVERALLMQVKDDLVGNVSNAIPAYGDAMSAYRGASGPISRMQVGRRIMEKADSSKVDQSGVPILSPFQYAKNTRNLDRVAQDATGFNKAKAANILSPEDIRNISAIGDDMQRIMRRQSNPAQPGSATMEAAELAKRFARQSLPSSLGRGVPIIEGVAEYLASRRNTKDMQTLLELYRNPQRAQQVMNQLSKKDRAKLNATLSMLAVGIQANNQEAQ